MKLVIGLGNPGDKYRFNRHNVGYQLVQKLWGSGRSSLITTRSSDVFMNDSGTAVKKLVDQYSLDVNDLYIVHDDLDIPLGSYKIQLGRGPKDHNGLNDIYDKLGTNEFWHVRIGVENRMQNAEVRISGEEYVLQDFTKDEAVVIERAIEEVCKKLVTISKSTS